MDLGGQANAPCRVLSAAKASLFRSHAATQSSPEQEALKVRPLVNRLKGASSWERHPVWVGANTDWSALGD